ncbi:MAG: sugar ABC transporter permease [Chloroflexi bacterium]|nr:sugar ABC transporter permease [Chloroflexota bacterium]
MSATPVTSAPPVVVSRRRPFLTRTDLTGYAFISLWLIGFVVFTLIPFVSSLFISFTNWKVVGAWKFVGFDNYIKMLSGRDNVFVAALTFTVVYTVVRVPLSQLIALGLATLLNQPIKGRPIFRTIFYLPAVTAGVATAFMWTTVFSNQGGFVNNVLKEFGITGPNWLYSLEWSPVTIIIVSLWNVGTSMLIYLAALQGVPESLHEAAMIDGAGVMRRFWNITIPMITPAIFFNTVLSLIGSFQGGFTESLIITNGGPGYSTTLYSLYLYRTAFQDALMGYASALAWFLFIVIMTFTLVQMAASKRWVYYEGDSERTDR